MSNVNLFNGATISVEGTNSSYHTFDSWGLYITNTDCIGEPIQDTHYVEVMGSNRQVDLSEALTGRIGYKSRKIKIELAGIREKTAWDSVVSDFRNKINGRVCRIIFDNDPSYFWRGRVSIKDFSSAMRLGTLKIEVPEADPYKYNLKTSNEPWYWDPFNFRTGIITKAGVTEVNGTATYYCPPGYMATSPEFVCIIASGDTLAVTDGKHNLNLKNGTVYDPRFVVNGDTAVTLTFTGKGKVEVAYRGGSL